MKRMLLLCLAGALGAAACGPDSTRNAPRAEAASVTWDALPDGWSELPPPPLIARPAARIWTGNELFVWSGYEHTGGTAPDQGAVFSPESNTWKPIASSPLSGRYASGAVWTGSEVLIWGGLHREQPLSDGAAYEPESDSWRQLPESPLSARAPVATIWTGTEMIVWGSRDRPAPAVDGAAYNPATNDWRKIATAPVEMNLGTGLWTGLEMLVYGSQLDHNNRSDSGANTGAAYDPSSDSWRALPETRLSPQATTLAWTGERAVAWDYELQASAYNPASDSWNDIPALPLDFSECYPSSVAVDSYVFGWFCGHAALFDDRTSMWTDISPDDPRLQPTSDVVAPVAAGSVVLLPGIRGTDESVLWAFKPPSDDDTRSATPDCGKTNIASDEYGTEIHPASGPPGTEVTFTGTTLRGEDWRWAPSDRLEAWWNTDAPASEVPGGTPVAAGPVVRLVRVDDMERCRFETTFTVPDVEPGRYKISVFSWFADPEDGYGLFLPHHFTVTSVPSECPRVGEGGYAIELSADSGPPGAAVTVSGATPVYAEDGSYVGPDGEIQFWWNADPDYWHDALPGPPGPVAKNRSAQVVSLGAVELTDCTFRFDFQVPDVAPGDYPILPLAFSFKDSGAGDSATFHAAYAPLFRVTENH